jgi:hypothetical protein
MALDVPAMYTHSLSEVIATVTRLATGESFDITGIKGDGIQIQRFEPKYVDPPEYSGDGAVVVRSATNNRGGKILITGVQYSPIHQQLAVLDVADPEDDRVEVTIRDLSNALLYKSIDGYLGKFADVGYADAQGNRTHELVSTFLEMDKDLT